MTYYWWAVAENIGDRQHLVGMDRDVVDIPDLFRTKRAADAFIAEWRRENPIVKTWGLRAVRVEIRKAEGST